MKIFKKRFFLFLITFFISYCGFAHYIWIESPNISKVGKEIKVKILYGEYNEGRQEVKGGRLEELDGIVFWAIGPNGEKEELEVHMETKYYQVKFTPTKKGRYTFIATNNVREVVDWSNHNIGVVRPVYYASTQINVSNISSKNSINTALYPELTMIPQSSKDKSKPQFKLLFNNKPLANAKISVHAPKEWSKDYETDSNGFFTFDSLCNGQYVIECIYKEEKTGVYKGKKYEASRHRATFTHFIK